MDLNPLSFYSCADLNNEVTVPDPNYKLRLIEKKLNSAKAAKLMMMAHLVCFDDEDILKIEEYICEVQKDLLNQIEEVSKVAKELTIAAAFAEQINKRNEIMKQVKKTMGFTKLDEYFDAKQQRLALLANESIQKALKKI